jgi:hypothetical protein
LAKNDQKSMFFKELTEKISKGAKMTQNRLKPSSMLFGQK